MTFLLSLVSIVLIGCGRSIQIEIDSDPNSPQERSQSTISTTNTTIPTQITTSTQEPDPALIPAPAGLIYCSDDALWAVHQNHNSIFLASDCRAYLSPDYKYILFEEIGEYYIKDLIAGKVIMELGLWDSDNDPEMLEADDLQFAVWSADSQEIIYNAGLYSDWPLTDVWMINILTGEKTNLTETAERIEGRPRLFNGQELIVFNSYRFDDENIHPLYKGFLTTMNRDGSNYTVSSEDPIHGDFELSPLGDAIAITGGYLYTQETGIQPINPLVTNPEEIVEYEVLDPSFSPDGRYLAWSAWYDSETTLKVGYGIHDLELNTIHFYYPNDAVNGEYSPPAPQWSPDSVWLSFNNPGPNTSEIGLSVIKVDGIEEYFFDNVDRKVWDPWSRYLVLNTGDFYNTTDQGVWILEVGDWQITEIDLPEDAVVIDWIDPEIIQSWSISEE